MHSLVFLFSPSLCQSTSIKWAIYGFGHLHGNQLEAYQVLVVNVHAFDFLLTAEVLSCSRRLLSQ